MERQAVSWNAHERARDEEEARFVGPTAGCRRGVSRSGSAVPKRGARVSIRPADA